MPRITNLRTVANPDRASRAHSGLGKCGAQKSGLRRFTALAVSPNAALDPICACAVLCAKRSRWTGFQPIRRSAEPIGPYAPSDLPAPIISNLRKKRFTRASTEIENIISQLILVFSRHGLQTTATSNWRSETLCTSSSPILRPSNGRRRGSARLAAW